MVELVERNVAVVLLYNDDGKVLLQHRTANALRSPNLWGFFGGEIEEGETSKDAVVREVQEELEYELNNPEYFSVTEFKTDANRGKIYLFLEKFDVSQKLVQHEGQGMDWFDPLDLSDLPIIPHDKPIIEAAGKVLRERGIGSNHT